MFHLDWWLVARDDVVEGLWEWSSTGKQFSISDCGPSEPDNNDNIQDCLLIWQSSNYMWDDKNCAARRNYICESRYGGIMYNKYS
jgi:hypothetical protein